MNFYTDPALLDAAGAVESLPKLNGTPHMLRNASRMASTKELPRNLTPDLTVNLDQGNLDQILSK